MILTPNTPGAQQARVFDAVTGEVLGFVLTISTKTWKAIRFVVQDGMVKKDADGTHWATFEHPNPVRVEWPGLDDLLAQEPA